MFHGWIAPRTDLVNAAAARGRVLTRRSYARLARDAETIGSELRQLGNAPAFDDLGERLVIDVDVVPVHRRQRCVTTPGFARVCSP